MEIAITRVVHVPDHTQTSAQDAFSMPHAIL
jgi:hypothetical protein